MEIRLERLELTNFKCHRQLSLAFGGENCVIYGDNGVGKTAVYDALCWLLWDRDGRGRGQVRVLPVGDDGLTVHPKMETSVKACLRVDGCPVTLERVLRQVRNIRDGRLEGHRSDYFWQGKPVCRTEFDKRLCRWMDAETFRILSDVSYFCRDLDGAGKRRALFSLLNLPQPKELMQTRAEFRELSQRLEHHSPEGYRKVLLARKKELLEEGDRLDQRMEEWTRAEEETRDLDFDALDRQRSRLEETIAARDGERQGVQEQLRRTQWVRLRLDNAESRGRALNQELARYDTALMELARHRRRAMEGTGRCPTCGQELPEGLSREEKERQRREWAAREAHLNRERQRVQKALEETDREVEELRREEDSRKALEGAAQPKPEGLEQARQELERVRELLRQQPLRVYARQRLEELEGSRRQTLEQLAQVERELAVLDRFSRFQTEYLEKQVNDCFSLAQFRLFHRNLEGNLEERCDVLLHGVPYADVNEAGKANLGLDIIGALSRKQGKFCPVFLDNGESVLRPMDIPGQRIRLVAVRDRELTLRKEGECGKEILPAE